MKEDEHPDQAGAAGAWDIPSSADSEGYPTDSGRYRSDEGHTEPEQGESEANAGGDLWALPPSPPKPPHVQRLESGRWVPGEELGIERLLDDDLHRYRPRDQQVNVRLRTIEMERLARAADLYGISPTGMARVFINRGARTVLEEWRRDDLLHIRGRR